VEWVGYEAAIFATFTYNGGLPVVGTSIHNGHHLRPEIARKIGIDSATRLREEDPYSSNFIAGFPNRVVVDRSRFEVDLNRPRSDAVYIEPEDAWGLHLWSEELTPAQITESRRLYDAFYADLGEMLDRMVETQGGFVLYDVHSYNYRRNGPDAPPEDPQANPMVNLGTGSLPPRWAIVAKAFLESIRHGGRIGDQIDARENVKFEGRAMAEFVHDRYGDVGCALAIEFRKDFMNEWTGELYPHLQKRLTRALDGTIGPVLGEWSTAHARQ
jgi:hypothetical protein